MNEKQNYETMLEIPVDTATVTVTVKPSKKRKKRVKSVDGEAVKQELIEKVNSQAVTEQAPPVLEQAEQSQEPLASLDLPVTEDIIEEDTASVKTVRKKRGFKNFKVSIIAVQFALIGVLVATIFLTSALNANSGINVFFRSVFGGQQTVKVDERLHNEFSPVISMQDGEYVMQDGVLTISATGSVYSPCDGKISSIAVDTDGKYTVEIEHSTNFKSVITGLDYVYGEQGSAVFGKLPVGYSTESGATMCFMGADGSVISGYQIIDNSVVWAV